MLLTVYSQLHFKAERVVYIEGVIKPLELQPLTDAMVFSPSSSLSSSSVSQTFESQRLGSLLLLNKTVGSQGLYFFSKKVMGFCRREGVLWMIVKANEESDASVKVVHNFR